MMAFHLKTKDLTVPLTDRGDSVIRVRGTRVTLDTIVAAFDRGATAEEITQQYPTVPLSDVYAVIAYYLAHQEEVRAYLRQRAEDRQQIRTEIEARFPPNGIRERLLARRSSGATGSGIASSGG
jgi:uncharacterized protein (DUF433 family)